MIVEDDPCMRELTEFVANQTGHFGAIMTASDGQAALEMLGAAAQASEALPDAILTDLTMPRLDGLDLARELHTQPALQHIPIVMFSSSKNPSDAEEAIRAGCRAFHTKPINPGGLIEILNSVAVLAVEHQHATAH